MHVGWLKRLGQKTPAPTTPTRPAHLNRGAAGEAAAADFLRRAGYRVRATNVRYGPHEVDIICEHGDTLVFVEVKTRDAAARTPGAAAVTPAKQRHLATCAARYASEYDLWERAMRFDVVEVRATQEQTYECTHYENAFTPPFDYNPF